MSATLRWSAIADDAAATGRLGEALGSASPEGATLLLEGPLGAGKTTFAQGVARGCGVAIPVSSPTYNLILHYQGRRPFTHVDLYRLAGGADLSTLDLDEVLGREGVTCIEWPGLVRGLVAAPYAEITIELAETREAPERRRISGRVAGAEWDRVRGALEAAGAEVEP